MVPPPRPASHRDVPAAESGPAPGADAGSSQGSEVADSFVNDAEVNSDDSVGSSPATSEHHLIDLQGLLNPPLPPADFPVNPPTVMQSSQDFSLLTDLNLSGSEDNLDGDEPSVDAVDEEFDDEEFVDADDVDSAGNHDVSSPSICVVLMPAKRV